MSNVVRPPGKPAGAAPVKPVGAALPKPTGAAPVKPAAPPPGVVFHSRPGACPSCGTTESWGSASWCPKCGYYPKLGTHMTPAEGGLGPDGQTGDAEELAPLPTWVWVLGGGVLVILIVSLVVRFQVPEDGPLTIWSLIQLLTGMLLLGLAHLQAYWIGASQTDRLTPSDLVFSPLHLWKPALRRLPDTAGLLCRGVWGATIALCAMLVTGGLGWEGISQLVEAHAKEHQFNALHKVVGFARAASVVTTEKEEPAENLEAAIGDLTGKVADDIIAEPPPQPPEVKPPTFKAECAVVGFTRSVSGELRTVLMARVVEGRPVQFVARLPAEDVPEDIRAQLEATLPTIRTRRPAVPCPMQAFWVAPRLSCFVGYDAADQESGQYQNAKVLELINPSQPKDAEKKPQSSVAPAQAEPPKQPGQASSSSSSPSS